MKTFLALGYIAIALAPALVTADFIPEGSAAHFFSTQSTPQPSRTVFHMHDDLTGHSPDASLVFARCQWR